MSGSRRTQRSARLAAACFLLVVAAALVATAVVMTKWVSAAAVLAVAFGVLSARMVYAEVLQTRRQAATDRAAQSRAFGALLARKQHDHTAFTRAVTITVHEQQRTITDLEAASRLAERRVDGAETRTQAEARRADEAQTRAQAEARRADEAQGRLSALLDEVLMYQPLSVVPDVPELPVGQEAPSFDSADLPTVIDLLAWEDQATVAAAATAATATAKAEGLRREA